MLAYTAGHAVANAASHLIDSKLVRGVLGIPTVNLFQDTPTTRWVKLFPGYYAPLPAEQQQRVLERATANAGITEPSQGLFYHCFGCVKKVDSIRTRLDLFVTIYGFCRNMAVALLVVGISLIIGSILGSAHTGDLVSPVWCGIACLIGSVTMVYHYLKFFRHYSVELFISYAELD